MEAAKKRRRKAKVDRKSCVACGCCVRVCTVGAIGILHGAFARVDWNRCVGCGKCAKECPASVIDIEEVFL